MARIAKITEKRISEIITRAYQQKLESIFDVDVAIAGAGPSGLIAAYYMAKAGLKCVIFERRLSPGGGIWGGAAMYNVAVLEEQAIPILEEIKAPYRGEGGGLFSADATALAAALIQSCNRTGVTIMNLWNVEDLTVIKRAVCGVVINWTGVELSRLHVDPLSVKARAVLDATGHEASLAHMLERQGLRLYTRTGRVIGQAPMWAERGEKEVVANAKEVFPGLFVAGMAANAVFGGHRMGAIFGGMLVSGKKIAGTIARRLALKEKKKPSKTPQAKRSS